MDQSLNPPTEEQTVNMTIPIEDPSIALSQAQSIVPLSEEQQTSVSNPQEAPTVKNETDIVGPYEDELLKEVKQPETAKHPGGRPCEYCLRKDEINKISGEYLQSAREAKLAKKAFIPYLQELADMLDCDSDRVSLWANKKTSTDELEHEEFHGIVKKLNNFKEWMLLQRTTGRFNPTGAIFQLKTKHGYIETEKQMLVGDKNEPINITIVEENNHVEES